MIAYFGYGSLVNRDTRPVDENAHRARLTGWERHWAHRVADDRNHRNCTSLSARPASEPATAIDGVVVLIEPSALPALDEREAGYFRQTIDRDAIQIDTDMAIDSIVLYQSHDKHFKPASAEHPILKSYVDCVMAGYSALFGEAGLSAFMQTTKGWHGDMLDDRHQPLYPRAVSLTAQQQKHFDSLVAEQR